MSQETPQEAQEARVRLLGEPAGSNALLRSLGCLEGSWEAGQRKAEDAMARIAVGRVLYETRGLGIEAREREVRSRLGIELEEAMSLLGPALAPEHELQDRDHQEDRIT